MRKFFGERRQKGKRAEREAHRGIVLEASAKKWKLAKTRLMIEKDG